MSEREPVDREQAKRDAEWLLDACSLAPDGGGAVVSRHCLALLAELEQAERRAKAGDAAHERMHAAEARLAKVPALVEALRRIEGNVHGAGAERFAASLAREALAAWESE